jgi:hypothetical protein
MTNAMAQIDSCIKLCGALVAIIRALCKRQNMAKQRAVARGGPAARFGPA